MPNKCSVCRRKNRQAIDLALIDGVSLRQLAQLTALGKDALQRHKARCIPDQLTIARNALHALDSAELLRRLTALYEDAESIKHNCLGAKNYLTALKGIRESARLLELLVDTQSRVNRDVGFDLLNSNEWVSLRTAILRALLPFPEARLAVSDAMSPENLEQVAKSIENMVT